MREGHDLVCGLKRLLRQSGSREAFRVAQETRLEVHSQVRPGTRTRVTHSDPIRHSATLPRPLLLVDRHPDSPCGRVAPPGKERTPPTPITPDPGCAWGPSLTWAGTCRASERLEPGRSLRLCSSGPLPPRPSRPHLLRPRRVGYRSNSPGPTPEDSASEGGLPGSHPAPSSPLHPLTAVLGANHAPFGEPPSHKPHPLGNSVRPFQGTPPPCSLERRLAPIGWPRPHARAPLLVPPLRAQVLHTPQAGPKYPDPLGCGEGCLSPGTRRPLTGCLAARGWRLL